MKTIQFTIFILIATALQTSMGQSKIIFTKPGLYPEGVAYHAGKKLYYVGSVTTAAIGSVDAAGKYKVIYQDSTLKSTYGMKVSPDQKTLWVCVSDANYSKFTDSSTYKKMGKLIAIDLASGKKSKEIDLAALEPGKHFINDLAFDAEGNMYATDSFSPVIYKIGKDGQASVFAKNDLFKGADIGLNGIAFHKDGYLIVNNNSQGAFYKVDLKNPAQVIRVKIKNLFPGADGMLFDGQGNLIVVQNKSVDKIFKLSSGDNWVSARMEGATAAEDRYQQPSTLTLAGSDVYVINSKMNELSDPVKRPSREFSIQKAEFKSVN